MVAEVTRLRVMEEVERAGNISQRALAVRLGMAVGAVNRHLRFLIRQGYLQVVDAAVRPFAYRLTAAGVAYRQRMRHVEYERVAGSYREMEERIGRRLRELKAKGVERVVFYGAGVVMEVTRPIAESLGLEVLGVVDDDPAKQGSERDGLRVLGPKSLENLDAQALVITTFRHAGEIRRRLKPVLGSQVLVWEL
jgi:DNA-binding MarR family transcriptional regulator